MTFVKVCGITSSEDARISAGAGVDAIGLLFAESPRRVSVERAKEISASLPDSVAKVGVFVDESPDTISRVASEVRLDFVQLHGDESPGDVSRLRESGLKVIKAMRVRDGESLRAMDLFEPDLFLLDAYSSKARGGTGEKFDWAVAKSLRGRANIVVSGGLSPENVREAVEFFEPYGVDASSSLEESPGIKDGELVRRFVRAAGS